MGQFYCLNAESFGRQGCLVMEHTLPYVQDIDTEEDWRLAELKYRMRQGGE